MDINQINNGLPQISLNPLTTQYSLAAGGNAISLSIQPNIDIPSGFIPGSSSVLVWNLSMDQHTLRFYIEEQFAADGTIQYVLRIVGQLFYNVVFSGLEPIAPLLGVNGEGAVFTAYGSINVNEIVGTFDNLSDINQIINGSFSITATTNTIFLVTSIGDIVLYDPNNPQPFKDALSSGQSVTIRGGHTIIVSFISGPS